MRNQFWPFTGVLRGIRPPVTRKIGKTTVDCTDATDRGGAVALETLFWRRAQTELSSGLGPENCPRRTPPTLVKRFLSRLNLLYCVPGCPDNLPRHAIRMQRMSPWLTSAAAATILLICVIRVIRGEAYFGASEATIFSKRGSPRNGSHVGSKRRSP
jgi:hypothetical protein